MKICIASDHRGFLLKTKLYNYLKQKYDITDLGPTTDEMTDYTKYGFKIGEEVRDKKYDFGIVICGSGIGISIACNKVKKVRCAKVNNKEEALLTRKDNDANVLALSGNTELEEAKEITETFLNTEFAGLERYKKRINDIERYETEGHV